MRTEKSAGVIVFRKDEEKIFYLLMKLNKAGHWDLPKGHIESGETEEQTALRETEEETGLKDVVLIPGFKETIKFFFKSSRDLISKTVIFFLGETKVKEVKISFEHLDHKWLEYEEAHKELTFKNAKDILEKADKFLKGKDSLKEFLS